MDRNPQLIYALLSMDSYHRGANGGLNGAPIAGPHPGVPASNLDGWSLLASTSQADSTAIGFAATAYRKGTKFKTA